MISSANSGIWEPTTAGDSKKLADSCEVTHLKLLSGGGAATVEIYDATSEIEATPTAKRWVLDSAQSANDSDHFDPPLQFNKGVFAKLTQGTGTNPIVCIAANKYNV